MSVSPHNNIVEARLEVQCKFGRNLLRIQQLEVMVKAMVAGSVVETQSGDPHIFFDKRKQDVFRKTLGQVVGDLTTSLLSPPVSNDDQEQELPGDPTKIRIRTSFQFEISPEDHQRMQLRLAELVDLRNTLAHHFIEIHDIRTEEGCAGAVAYLDDSFHLIDERFEELRKLAQHLVETSMDMVNFMRSPDNMESLIQTFFPATAGLASTSCTFVNLFRDAEAELAQDGWTSLAKAIEYITGRDPSHTPRRYGCSSWRQVLHESGLFTIRHEQTKPGAKRDTWYRSRDL